MMTDVITEDDVMVGRRLKKNKKPAIFETTDYSIFKRIKGNRSLQKGHLLKLTNSILKNNLLSQNPIVVNENMEVIDGQHRLKIAEDNSLVIYYTMAEGSSLEDVRRLNYAIKQWSMLDYLNSYIEQGLTHYKVLKDYMDKTGLSLSNAGMILGARTKQAAFHGSRYEFKAGEFKVEDVQRGERMAQILEDLNPYFKSNLLKNNRILLAALMGLDRLSEEGKMDWQKMLEKFVESQKIIERMYTVRDYLRFFEDVYNWRVKNPIRFF